MVELKRGWILAVLSVAACGGGGTEAESGTDGGSSGSTSVASTTSTSGLPTGSTSAGDSTGPAGGSSEESSDGGSTSTGPAEGSSSSTGEPVAACKDAPVLGQDYSYLWVANSAEGTISKINTETLLEEGRYLARPDGAGSPSRTSVSLNGDVAVANRSGGITVVNGLLENCEDAMNTSSGPDDVLAWPDGCIAWHTPFNYSTQRPVAWTRGEFSEETCRWENTKLWTAGASSSSATIEFLLLDGDTGAVEETIPTNEPANTFGAYGGAVDAEGNFWASMLSGQVLFRVDFRNFGLQQWAAPAGYGIAIDAQGRPWTCQSQMSRFDPETETWAFAGQGVASGGGCMVDGNNTIWVGGSGSNLVGFDVDTMEVTQTIPMPGYAKGVSVDYAGNIWAVSLGSDAWRVDPETETINTVTGLVSPYTYSDMTGYALQLQSGL